jgi:endoglucanase
MPVLVVYNIPQRDCGSYSAGGAASPADYRAWIGEVARGLGQARVALILEPDALAGIGCLSPSDQQTRIALLAQATRTLTAADPYASVYLDAGHSAWEPARVMVKRLLAAGVSGARGFSLNVSNFNTTAAEVAYGQRLLAGLGSGHGFVIDTSRSGNGPAPANAWCNPGGRALGQAPQAAPSLPGVDALLWVKAPGESDGTCNGGPQAGDWWPDYALGLAHRAGWTG